MADRIALIEIVYTPTRGKAPAAAEAIEDAVDELFMRLTDGLIDAGASTVRILRDGR